MNETFNITFSREYVDRVLSKYFNFLFNGDFKEMITDAIIIASPIWNTRLSAIAGFGPLDPMNPQDRDQFQS